MSGDGPDMTPQGLSDAINDLVKDLPAHRERVSESWQKVLVFQVLTTLFEGVWAAEPRSSDELLRACLKAGSALSRAIELLLSERPALQQALITAFNLDDQTPDRNTAFADSPLAQLVLVAASEVRDGRAPVEECAVCWPQPPRGAQVGPGAPGAIR